MSETPKCTSWLGHKFEGRYSSEPNDRLKSFKVSNILPEDLPTLLTVRVYERPHLQNVPPLDSADGDLLRDVSQHVGRAWRAYRCLWRGHMQPSLVPRRHE